MLLCLGLELTSHKILIFCGHLFSFNEYLLLAIFSNRNPQKKLDQTMT